MATTREHQQADMERLFARDGEAVVEVDIDGKKYRALKKDLETDPSIYMGMYVSRISIWLLPGALTPFPVPEQPLIFNGKRHEVEASNTTGILEQLILGRLAG